MNNIDQFYTNDNIALYCYNILLDKINKKDYDIFLEPSAGNGSFYKLFDKDKRLGIDIKFLANNRNLIEIGEFSWILLAKSSNTR